VAQGDPRAHGVQRVGVVFLFVFPDVGLEPQRQIEQEGFGEGQFVVVGFGAERGLQAHGLPVAQEVLLNDLRHDHRLVHGAVPRADHEHAGVFFLDPDVDVHLVVRRLVRLDVHFFEIAKLVEVFVAFFQLGGGIQIPLHDEQRTADHFVAGGGVAGNADAGDVDQFAFLQEEVQIHQLLLFMGGDLGIDVGIGVPFVVGRCRDHLHVLHDRFPAVVAAAFGL